MKIFQFYYFKMKDFCSPKETIERVKWQATKKIFIGIVKLHISDKELISGIYKDVYESTKTIQQKMGPPQNYTGMSQKRIHK